MPCGKMQVPNYLEASELSQGTNPGESGQLSRSQSGLQPEANCRKAPKCTLDWAKDGCLVLPANVGA